MQGWTLYTGWTGCPVQNGALNVLQICAKNKDYKMIISGVHTLILVTCIGVMLYVLETEQTGKIES